MSAAIRTVEVGEFGEAKYDSDMEMGALKGLLTSAQGNDVEGVIESLSDIVVEWPFKGDPNEAADWDGLRRTQFNALVGAVTADLGALGEA